MPSLAASNSTDAIPSRRPADDFRRHVERAAIIPPLPQCSRLTPMRTLRWAMRCLQKGTTLPAEAAFKAALKSEPNRAVYHLNIGNLFSEMDVAKKAGKAFRRALALEPATWNGCAAANGLSNLLEGSDRSAESRGRLFCCIAASDQCPYAAHNLGRLLRRRGKHDEAVELARKALALAPTQREFITGLAAALHAAERLEEAIKIYRTALASGPSDHGLATDLANALVQANRHVEAIDAYVNALPLQLAHAAATLPASAPPQRRRTRGASGSSFIAGCALTGCGCLGA